MPANQHLSFSAGLPQAVPGDYGKYKSTTEKNKVVIILFNISLIPGQNNLKASKACSVNAIAFSSWQRAYIMSCLHKSSVYLIFWKAL